MNFLKEGEYFTDNVKDFARGKGGELYLYKAESKLNIKDWSKAGHIMRQVGGQITVHSKQDPNQEPIRKITHKIVTQSNKNGDVSFERYAWTISSLPNIVLIQCTWKC